MPLLSTIRRFKWIAPLLGGLIIIVAVALYFKDQKQRHSDETTLSEHKDHGLERSTDAAGKVVWTCSMHPQIQLPEPGKCPICFMDLIKLELDANKAAAQSLRQVEMNADSRKLAEIVVTPVRKQSVALDVRMVGKVEYDETRVGSITAWMGGRIDRLYVDSTGSVVQRGQAMASIYSPELLTAQAELLQAVKAINDAKSSNLDLVRRTAQRTLEASREKLRLLGLSKAQIDAVIANGKPSDHITLHAPQGGIVIKKDVVEGMYVQTGMPIYTIADLSHVWVVLEAYESDLPWIKTGLDVAFAAEAYPGRNYKGRIVYIDPVVNPKTRTVDVRLEVPNGDASLKPGMFVQAVQRIGGRQAESASGKGDPLVIPVSAPLITGKRAVVYVQPKDKPGTYIGREVVLGPRAGETYIVRSGLDEGELVVSKGAFKIDSALQIQAKPSMMNPGSAEAPISHVHGQPQDSMTQGTAARYEAPPLLLSKLSFLGKHVGVIDDALRASDVDRAKALYAQMNSDLNALADSVDQNAMLEGEAKLAWKEFAMLLMNDAVLGSEAKDFKRLHEVHALTHTHFGNLAAAFGVPAAAEGQSPQAFRQQVGTVFGAYTPISEALGNDDPETARKAIPALVKALATVDTSLLDQEGLAVWNSSLSRMQEGIDGMSKADSIEALRAGFEHLSIGLTAAVMRLGVFTDGPVYELHCPMAFDNKGANWLQTDEDIRNPYFGAAMYKCGEVTRQLKDK
ncbi:efflux RND transporter periplasmic adaptor subunit [Desulfovibrio mangrovi]|uniref:efflux RND transporter periplasmic adaptor subunit n=1 Tax=Desulfovibrio mangrovi TaxID=2976983 RepID=UPI002247AEE2|nr:efflux RND transporter periplasmic adaptor subunit [Desulfovibrio mangrovi]UZP66199.1 efflux RND transporter periplasmic adaptor subunit [Desulfovibrio mangrovi]